MQSQSPARLVDDNTFVLNRRLMQNSAYTVSLKNGQVASPSTIQYNVQVIPDRYPQISVDRIQDTVTYNYIALSGLVSDDYGFSKLRLNYKINRNGKASPIYVKDIPVNKSTTSQNFVYNWSLDSLKLGQEDRLEYFVQVWDNDGVNGAKVKSFESIKFCQCPQMLKFKSRLINQLRKQSSRLTMPLAKHRRSKRNFKQWKTG